MTEATGTIALQSAVAPRDLKIETCVALGAVWSVGGVDVPPLTAGRLVFLEMVESPFIPDDEDPRDMTEESVVDALGIMYAGQDCVQAFFQCMHGNSAPWDAMAGAARRRLGDCHAGVAQTILGTMQHALAGFQMIHWPADQQSGVRGLFDIAWLAGLTRSVCAACPQFTHDAVAWDLPLGMAGHLAAVAAGRDGAEVHRPVDIEAARARKDALEAEGN